MTMTAEVVFRPGQQLRFKGNQVQTLQFARVGITGGRFFRRFHM